MIKIESLHYYPIKSCRGIDVNSLKINFNGPHYDRHWMFVDNTGNFITQRSHPKLAKVAAYFPYSSSANMNEDVLEVEIGEDRFQINIKEEPSETLPVTVWGTNDMAHVESKFISLAATELLGQSVKLVRFGSKSSRAVAFSDTSSVHLTNNKSLTELQNKIGDAATAKEITMRRFRPNIVISGVEAYEEDIFTSIKIGSVVLKNIKPAARCPITTVDQTTGVPINKEPLKTLAQTRRVENKVLFGIHMMPQSEGIINIHDQIYISE